MTIKTSEFHFKQDFINLLLTHIDAKLLRNVYNINTNTKYTIDYILDIMIAISSKSYARFRIPTDLAKYFKESEYSKFSRTSLKSLIKTQILYATDNSFFNTYVVIGHDIPVTIKELVVVC